MKASAALWQFQLISEENEGTPPTQVTFKTCQGQLLWQNQWKSSLVYKGKLGGEGGTNATASWGLVNVSLKYA